MSQELLILLDYEQEVLDKLAQVAPHYKIITDIEQADFEKVEIVFGWDKHLETVLENKHHSIRWIQLHTAGVDKMPMTLMKEQGVRLTSASGMHKHSLTESIFGMLLGYTRRIIQSSKDQKERLWNQDELNPIVLTNKTIAIIGIGRIGAEVAKVAKTFGMRTIGVNRSGGLVSNVDNVYTQDHLAEAVAQADIVVNILPLTSETEGIFNWNMFKEFKTGSIFINVGRGESVKTTDLIQALEKKIIKFAGLDVFEQEPLETDSELYSREDVLITPHIAGFMDDYLGTLLPIFEENLKAYVNHGDLVQSVVDLDKQY